MKNAISILAVSILTIVQVFAIKADSLLDAALQHTRHGRFDKCYELLGETVDNLSKRDRKTAYDILAMNANLAGDYANLCRYVKMAKKKPSEFVRILSEQPLQSVSKPKADVTVNFSVDSLFYNGEFKGCEIRIPVLIDGKEEKLILDNGCAQFSFASESFAHSHGIIPVGASGIASGVVDTASMWIGLCKSLSIGEIVFSNILFVVVPDKSLENPVTEINALIGSNMLRLVGEIAFNNIEHVVTFPAKQEEMESNLMYEGDGLQYLDVELRDQSLRFQLDLGSTFTRMNARFYDEYKQLVESEGTRTTKMKGGVGGMVEEECYVIPDLNFTACGGSLVQKKTIVSTGHDSFSVNNYGSVGADYLLSFGRAVLNLEKMFFYVFPDEN